LLNAVLSAKPKRAATACSLSTTLNDRTRLLAIAYSRTGRKEDGDKQFAIQKQLTQKGAAGEDNSQSQAKPN
jgi:hypothetical protein